MNVEEAFVVVKKEKSSILHISGKTSTGKSTFAQRLKNELGYEIIELDKIVSDFVIQPLQLSDRGKVFFEVYKNRKEKDWIKLLVAATTKSIDRQIQNNHSVVLDGAIAHPDTLQEILKPFPETSIYYFHPTDLITYQKYLTERFMLTDIDNHAGLPIAFWEFIDENDFKKFCQNRKLTPSLRKAIQEYAQQSQNISTKRLEKFKNYFSNIKTVEV